MARQDLPAGTRLEATDLELAPMELAPALQARVFDSPEPLLGATLLAPLGAGELLQSSVVVARKGDTSSRELSFTVERGRLSPAVKQGERADLLATYGSGTDAFTAVVVRHALLVAIERPRSATDSGRPRSRWPSTTRRRPGPGPCHPARQAHPGASHGGATPAGRATHVPHRPGLMAAERYVVLGLAPARSAWFRSVGLWANSGALPADFVRCISAEEVRARLASGRAFSALVADAGLPAVDRDLLAAARAAGCAVLVVDDGRATRDWLELGAARVLPPAFGRDELVAALTSCAHPVRRGEADPSDLLTRPAPVAWRGSVAAVTGSGGTGVSTLAIALAQSLADDVRHGGMVLLADLRLRAEQAVLHDAGDVLPCVQELVEAHRSGQPTADDVRSLAFAVPERRYHVLLGLRRARHWPAIRPQAFEAAFDSLRRAWGVVVCDIDADLEGEDDAGSIDIEERNVMARTAVAQADVVFAVGLPELKGVHSLVRVIEELVGLRRRCRPDRSGRQPGTPFRPGPGRAGRGGRRAHRPLRRRPADEPDPRPRAVQRRGRPPRRRPAALRPGRAAGRRLQGHARPSPGSRWPPRRSPYVPAPSATGPRRRSDEHRGGPRMSEVSPLQDIERKVQLRAKEISLDMAGEGGKPKLRSLIAEEVSALVRRLQAWAAGLRPGRPRDRGERAYRNLAGYGPLEPLLDDDDVWEIMVNNPDLIFPAQVFVVPAP